MGWYISCFFIVLPTFPKPPSPNSSFSTYLSSYSVALFSILSLSLQHLLSFRQVKFREGKDLKEKKEVIKRTDLKGCTGHRLLRQGMMGLLECSTSHKCQRSIWQLQQLVLSLWQSFLKILLWSCASTASCVSSVLNSGLRTIRAPHVYGVACYSTISQTIFHHHARDALPVC